MSVFGQTQHQPRIIAHDSIALNQLCTYPGIITGLAVPPPPVADQGEDYIAATIYNTTTSGSGFGATVEVLAIGAQGEVLDYTLANGGKDYAVGDVLTLVGQGSNNQCKITVLTINSCGSWDEADPIVTWPSQTYRQRVRPQVDLSPAWDKEVFRYNFGGKNYQAGGSAALYVGIDIEELEVILEGAADPIVGNQPTVGATRTTVYHNVPAGTFMPIAALTITSATAADPVTYPDPYDYILAQF